MNIDKIKEIIIDLLDTEQFIYKSISENIKHKEYEEMIIAIERIKGHIKTKVYDERIQEFLDYFNEEILKEADKEIEKKNKRKKKAE